MQNASRNLWKLTGWKGPTDHGTVAAGAAMAGMSGMAGMDHSQMGGAVMPGMDHSQMAAGGAGMAGMDHSAMRADRARLAAWPGWTRVGWRHEHEHARPEECAGREDGAGRADHLADAEGPQRRTAPGSGGPGSRVLTYRDLSRSRPTPTCAPSRQFEIHLTGNMERYMWGFDGQKLSDPADPIPFRKGERRGSRWSTTR
jgi:FtsP/CotA-like multicopper oxidase with cupredoxin domain